MPAIILNGPAGRLEGRYHHSKTPNAPLAMLLHPHPQHGGTMNNAITFAMFKTFVERGFTVLRFNFRGVGNSQGAYDEGEGELADAACALDWMQSINPNAPYTWIGGFNFGAWIGMQLLMRRPESAGFISVAPPANLHDFSFLAPCPTNGLVISGELDNIVPPTHVEKMVERIRLQKGIDIDFRTVEGANHFFTDKLDALTSAIHDHLNEAEDGGQFVDISQRQAA